MKLGFLAGYICLSLSIVIMGSCIGETKKMSDQPQGLLSGFDGFEELKGIEPPKDVHARPISMLETLTELAFHTIHFFSPNFSDKFKQYGDRPSSCNFMEVYCFIQPQLEALCFDETDISSFVGGFSNTDYPKHESQILGIFTSCLAYTLTERNRTQGKRTMIYVDGKGARFDYLFSCLPDFDEIIIENFIGDYIGHSNGGYGNSFISRGTPLEKDITRDCGDPERYIKIASSLRREKRTHKRIFGINLKGECIFGYAGGIDQIVLINIDGRYAGVNCGGYAESFVDQLIGVNIKGNNALSGVGKEGSVNHVVAANVEGKEALENIASSYLVNKIIVDNIKGEEAFKGYQSGRNLNQLIFKNSMNLASDVKFLYKKGGTTIERLQGQFYFNGGCKELICVETATSEQQEVIRREKVEEILRLTHSLPGKPYQEVLRIANELYRLRLEVPKEFFK